MPDPSASALIALQAAALFRYDGAGRLVGTNEPEPGPAPRLFLGRTREGNVWRFSQDVPDALASSLDEALRGEPPATELDRPPVCLDALVGLLETHRPVSSRWSGPAWAVPTDATPPPGIETTERLGPSFLHGAMPLFASTQATTLPYAAVVVDGRVVSLCSCSRITDAVAEAGVHTLPAYRGRGYAAAVTAAWAEAVRATGSIPLYSTSWDNVASRRVAAKLGLALYGADLWLA